MDNSYILEDNSYILEDAFNMELKEDADYYFIIAIIETNIIIKYDLLIYKCSKD